MTWVHRVVVIIAKCISVISTRLGFGAGETWPGEIALTLSPSIATALTKDLPKGAILVVGTNGKTTTSAMITAVFAGCGEIIVHNTTGANLLNGIVSSCIRQADWLGRLSADRAVFEVDENSLPIVLRYITPTHIVLLNLFRDQLDRYGEVDVIVEKWQRALAGLPVSVRVIVNSDDPGIAWLGRSVKGKVTYFGVEDPGEYLKKREHATDSIFCPSCGTRLMYTGVYYSHIGVWHCPSCGYKRPKPDVSGWPGTLPGLYNRSNTLAAVATARSVGLSKTRIRHALSGFAPAFGRQEEIRVDGKTAKVFLSKNPAGFNVSLRTVVEAGAKHILFVLNDRIPDGRDVSWIWDVDVEMLPSSVRTTVSGDRVYDMALRLKYGGVDGERMAVELSLEDAVSSALARVPRGGTLYVLPTYSAMLDVRKILTGRKIL